MLKLRVDFCPVSKRLLKSVLIFVCAAGVAAVLCAFFSNTQFSEQCRKVITNVRAGDAFIDAQQIVAYCLSPADGNETQSLMVLVTVSGIFAVFVGAYIWMKSLPTMEEPVNNSPRHSAPNRLRLALSAGEQPGSSSMPSIISAGVTITGVLETSGDLTIEGRHNGSIHCKCLVIGEAGEVFGDVVADRVFVHGFLKGMVRAGHLLLSSRARLTGDCVQTTLAVEAGAQISGQIRHSDNSPRADSATLLPQTKPPSLWEDKNEEFEGEPVSVALG